MTKMNRKFMPEWMLLDIMYSIGLIIYVLAQIIYFGNVTDLIFILMLSLATFFLNYRQLNLYCALIEKENEQLFADPLLQDKFKEQIKSIFLRRCDNYLALIFATVFTAVIWHFNMWNDCIELKIALSIFLFFANIPTGYALIRILKYFYYNKEWIENIKIEFGVHSAVSERFIKNICVKVLFTAVVYCTISLSSILFTTMQINAIVTIYTIFAAILVMISLTLTGTLLRRRISAVNTLVIEQINQKIAKIILNEIDTDRITEENIQKMKELLEIKEYVCNEDKNKINFTKILSGMGLLLVTVIPVFLQWILDRM